MGYTLEESFSTPLTGFGYVTAAVYALAQTFLAESSYELPKVELLMYREGTPPNITVEIESTSVGLPTNSVLATQSIDISGITTNTDGEWVSIVFDTPTTLTNGVTYAIVVRGGWTDANNRYKLAYNSSGIHYTNGAKCYAIDGSTWHAQNQDMGFKNYSGGVNWPVGTIAGASGQSGILTFDVLGLAGTIAGVAVASGPIVAERSISGTIAGVSTLSGPLSGAVVIITGTIVAAATLSSNILLVNILRVATISNRRRLIAVGNNKLYYEDI